MLRICLTGGICAGKSTVTRLFAELGAPIIDMDIIAREVVEPGTKCLAAIVDRFGHEVLNNNELNRAALRTRIFADEDDKKWLEDLLHPEIRKQVVLNIERNDAPYVLIAIPLYAESDGIDFIDRVCVIDTLPEIQVERLMQRDQCTSAEAENIIAQQASREQRLALADDVILNNGDIDALSVRVRALHEGWLANTKSQTDRAE